MNIDNKYDKLIIHIDAEKLRQIIATLIENALKYTYQGYVEYGYAVDNEKLKFYVKDTGIGIPDEKIKSVFEKFGKFNNPNFQYRGAGLGLAITKSLINYMGGLIWVESKEGVGSQFNFTLPLKVIKNQILTENTNKEFDLTADWGTKKILIAEAEEVNFKLMKASLSITKSTIIWVQNGKEAIKKFNEDNSIDIVFMDMSMSEMEGFDATKQIKKLNNKVPIIALTSYSVFGEKERSFEAGCDDYLTKPFTTIDLLSILNKYLGQNNHTY